MNYFRLLYAVTSVEVATFRLHNTSLLQTTWWQLVKRRHIMEVIFIIHDALKSSVQLTCVDIRIKYLVKQTITFKVLL